jgi:hypothetical protein
MHRSRWLATFLALAALFVTMGVLVAQSTDDLPAAPSEANKPKPAPKKVDPPQQPAPNQPAQSSNGGPQQEGRASASTTAPTGNLPDDEPVLNSETTYKALVNEVSVVFTVTDKHNRYVKDLNQEDFKVVDDSRPVGQFRFRREKDLPLQVGLLIDASNSIRDRFKFEQESAIEFLNEIIRPRYDKAFVSHPGLYRQHGEAGHRCAFA